MSLKPSPETPSLDPYKPSLSTETLALLTFLAVEVILFVVLLGLRQSFTTAKSHWHNDQVFLPLWTTGINSLILLYSGYSLWLGGLFFSQGLVEKTKKQLCYTLALGGFFMLFQGYEWVMLIQQSLNWISNKEAVVCCLLLCLLGLHALSAITALAWIRTRLRGAAEAEIFRMTRYGWYFVLGMWPLVYCSLY